MMERMTQYENQNFLGFGFHDSNMQSNIRIPKNTYCKSQNHYQ